MPSCVAKHCADLLMSKHQDPKSVGIDHRPLKQVEAPDAKDPTVFMQPFVVRASVEDKSSLTHFEKELASVYEDNKQKAMNKMVSVEKYIEEKKVLQGRK